MPTITGTDGPDYLVGPGSGDTIVGGSGIDTANYRYSEGGMTITLTDAPRG